MITMLPDLRYGYIRKGDFIHDCWNGETFTVTSVTINAVCTILACDSQQRPLQLEGAINSSVNDRFKVFRDVTFPNTNKSE